MLSSYPASQLRVTIGLNENGVRGLITTMDVKKSEVLLEIPDHIILSVRNAPAAVRPRRILPPQDPHLLQQLHMLHPAPRANSPRMTVCTADT